MKRGRGMALALAGALLLAPGMARADAVDDAYQEGNAAAKRGDWEGAVAAYERARSILPGRSAPLSYDLGTAHAHLGELGQATYHLRLALAADPDAAVREAARRNLGIVRRRMELQAAMEGAQISPPDDWRDRLRDVLAAPWLGALSLLFGWSGVALWLARRRLVDDTRLRGTLGVLALAAMIAFGVGSTAHGWALWSSAGEEVIVLPRLAEVREGPGRHRAVAFELQGGSSARLLESSSGWTKIRVEGGLEGWVEEGTLGHLVTEGAAGSAEKAGGRR